MATVDKNFRIKHGLVVEGTTGTINGNTILTENGGDSYILDLVGGATLVKSVDTAVFNVDGSGYLTVNANTFDSYGSASTAESNAKSYADGLATNYDPAGAAATAQGNAEDYADTVAGTAESNAKSYADGLAVNYDAAGSASAAQANAEDYADTVAGTAESNAKSYADGLATNYDPAGAAATAQGNAESYADGIVGDVLAGDTAFTAVNVNAVAGVYAATTPVASASTITAWSFDSATFTSAKLLVKLKTATHSQISDVLLTLDAAGNVAITEYGIVGTNGSLGDVTAVNSSGTINIRVTTAYANTNVMIYATAII